MHVVVVCCCCLWQVLCCVVSRWLWSDVTDGRFSSWMQNTCVLPYLWFPAGFEFNIYLPTLCCYLQALREIPGHAKDIVTLLALYREVAVPQGMWAQNQRDVCSIFLSWWLTVAQDPFSLITLFAKFLEYVLSCKVFTLGILIDSAKKLSMPDIGTWWNYIMVVVLRIGRSPFAVMSQAL